MDNDIDKKISNIECNCCCIKEKNIIICSNNNCNYPLCEKCMNKIIETNSLCPSCRREINFRNNNLERITNNIDYYNENMNIYIRISNIWWYIINKLIYFYSLVRCDNIFHIIFWYCFFCLIFIILTFIGRIVTIILILGPIDFFCNSMGIMYILFYLLWSLLGILILFIILIIISFLIFLIFLI